MKKQASAALQQINLEIINELPIFVSIKTPELRYLACNQQVNHFLGLTHDTAIHGLNDLDLGTHDDMMYQQLIQADAHVFETGESTQIPSVLMIAGNLVSGVATRKPLFATDGELLGLANAFVPTNHTLYSHNEMRFLIDQAAAALGI